MKRISQVGLVVCGVAVQLVTAGCLGLGGGSGGLFGSSEGSGSGGSGSASEGPFASQSLTNGGLGGNESGSTLEVATLANPEPASLALFGGGLAGLACLRRRKSRRK